MSQNSGFRSLRDMRLRWVPHPSTLPDCRILKEQIQKMVSKKCTTVILAHIQRGRYIVLLIGYWQLPAKSGYIRKQQKDSTHGNYHS